MDKRFFFAALGGASLAELYRARVLADGGIVHDYAAVVEAYAQATEWGVEAARTHWTSPRFGYKLSASGQLITRYDLFGHDAVTSSAEFPWLFVPPASSGKAPQHNTNGAAFVFPSLDWNSIDLLAHAICQPSSWTSDSYPYFPIVEGSGAPGAYAGFLLSGESGGMEAGYQDPNGVIVATSLGYPAVGALAALALQVSSALPQTPRLWVNAAPATGQYASGQPTLPAYDRQPVYLGARGQATNFYFRGNINDVFVTNKVLPDAARAWLDFQVTTY